MIAMKRQRRSENRDETETRRRQLLEDSRLPDGFATNGVGTSAWMIY